MNVILYMAMSVNGYIAKEGDETPWSATEWERFSTFVKKTGNLIVGRTTFEIMNKHNEFQQIGNPDTVVVSNTQTTAPNFVDSPEKAIKLLEERGFSEILVAGGGMLNTSFLKKGLIDEIYLDVEPFLFGKGIKLFSDDDFEVNLELLEIRKLSNNSLQLHYKVIT